MKKFFYTVILTVVAITTLSSCLGNTIEDQYKDWREKNDAWFQQQSASGQYTMLTAPWDPSAKTLIRWHNDTMLTRNNLKPFLCTTLSSRQWERSLM